MFQELVTIAPWTFIFTICNLFIQMYLIKRFLFKPINEVLEKRRALADAEIDQAREAKEQAEAMKADYEADMAKAKEKASELLESAQKTAVARSEAILQEANDQAAAIKERAQMQIAQDQKKAVSALRGEIGSIAMEIAGRALEREIDENEHSKLINEFIENVGEAS